jgi:hypothetical protein
VRRCGRKITLPICPGKTRGSPLEGLAVSEASALTRQAPRREGVARSQRPAGGQDHRGHRGHRGHTVSSDPSGPMTPMPPMPPAIALRMRRRHPEPKWSAY